MLYQVSVTSKSHVKRVMRARCVVFAGSAPCVTTTTCVSTATCPTNMMTSLTSSPELTLINPSGTRSLNVFVVLCSLLSNRCTMSTSQLHTQLCHPYTPDRRHTAKHQDHWSLVTENRTLKRKHPLRFMNAVLSFFSFLDVYLWYLNTNLTRRTRSHHPLTLNRCQCEATGRYPCGLQSVLHGYKICPVYSQVNSI